MNYKRNCAWYAVIQYESRLLCVSRFRNRHVHSQFDLSVYLLMTLGFLKQKETIQNLHSQNFRIYVLARNCVMAENFAHVWVIPNGLLCVTSTLYASITVLVTHNSRRF